MVGLLGRFALSRRHAAGNAVRVSRWRETVVAEEVRSGVRGRQNAVHRCESCRGAGRWLPWKCQVGVCPLSTRVARRSGEGGRQKDKGKQWEVLDSEVWPEWYGGGFSSG